MGKGKSAAPLSPKSEQKRQQRNADRRRMRETWVRPSKTLVAAMKSAGAELDELGGEDVRVVHISGLDSPAWTLYSDWANALERGEPVVDTAHTPKASFVSVDPNAQIAQHIEVETESIVELMSKLTMADVPESGDVDLAGPLRMPVWKPTFCDVHVALTPLIQKLRNPGPKFPAIRVGVLCVPPDVHVHGDLRPNLSRRLDFVNVMNSV